MPWQIQTCMQFLYLSSTPWLLFRFKGDRVDQMLFKRQSEQVVQSPSDIDGASPKPKRLHLEKDETDSLYHYPIQECDHDGFQSQRGCRKHVNTKHS